MGYNLQALDLKVVVSESYIRAGDMATLLGAINTLYEALAAVCLFESEPFEKRLLNLESDANVLLRITKISGSDIKVSLFGVDKALEVLRKIVDDIRFRKERKIREEEKAKQLKEKTAQERETTEQMRQENVRRSLDTFKEFKNMSLEDQREFIRLTRSSVLAIEQNRNTLLPQ
jgi:hypothetical protein